jgi:hypothetical protein
MRSADRVSISPPPPGPPPGVATMSIVRWVLVLLTGLVATASIVGFAGAHVGAHRHASSEPLYQCPMHPSVVQDHPGECPICSMTLVLKPEGAPNGAPKPGPLGSGVAGHADIQLTPERIQLIGMRTAKVKREAIGGELRSVGVVAANERRPTHVWVTAEIYEPDISRVHLGQRARLELAAYPGETQTGEVTFIYPVLDSTSHTLRVRIELKSPSDRHGPRLRPGLSATAYLELPSTTGLTVPAEAVVDTGEARYLFVSQGAGRVAPRAVTVGARRDDRVQILSGVSEGETVVTTGNFLVDSESRLRSAIEGP